MVGALVAFDVAGTMTDAPTSERRNPRRVLILIPFPSAKRHAGPLSKIINSQFIDSKQF